MSRESKVFVEFATDYVYKLSWKDIAQHAIIGVTPDFKYNDNIIILEIDNCILKQVPNTRLYDKMNPKELEIYDPEFMSRLKRQSALYSIIILTNAEKPQSSLSNDIIKSKIEWIYNNVGIEFLTIAAVKNSCFLKPHTGMFRLLKAVYKKEKRNSVLGLHTTNNIVSGETSYDNTSDYDQIPLVISEYGGTILDEKKVFSDVDRAFAWNISARFATIDEYMGRVKREKYMWNNQVLSIAERMQYYKASLQIENIKILKTIKSFPDSQNYLIMIYGAPCSGKTTLAKKIVTAWSNTDLNETHSLVCLGSDEYIPSKLIKKFKQLVDKRISIILDNNCYNDLKREPFITIAKEHNMPILIIEVDVAIGMAEIFNHARVEESHDTLISLIPHKEYTTYKSKSQAPTYDDTYPITAIKHIPRIEPRNSIMKFMY
jgi:predicted kinase